MGIIRLKKTFVFVNIKIYLAVAISRNDDNMKLENTSMFQIGILLLGFAFVAIHFFSLQNDVSANTNTQIQNAIALEIMSANNAPKIASTDLIAQSIKSAINADVTDLPVWYIDPTGKLYGYNDLGLSQNGITKRSHIVIATDNLPSRVRDYPIDKDSEKEPSINKKTVPSYLPNQSWNIEGWDVGEYRYTDIEQPQSEEMRGHDAYQLGGLLDCKKGGCKYTVQIE